MYLSARELLRRYKVRELSPVDVLDATVGRIDAVNPRLNALVTPSGVPPVETPERNWYLPGDCAILLRAEADAAAAG